MIAGECSKLLPNFGTAFKITTSGMLTTLYSFCSQNSCKDGAIPQAGLVEGTDGNFYGTTSAYGGEPSGGGTVFKITTTGVLTTLHSFCSQSSCADGQEPAAPLVEATDGDFYGTTYQGGTYDYGTIFKITSAGTLTTLYTFCSQSNCPDGANPNAGLIEATGGNFYGITVNGGTNGLHYGTVFELSASNAFKTLYNFCSEVSCADGTGPSAMFQDANGTLYGTTGLGGASNSGTVFSLSVTPPLSLGLHFDFDGSGTGTDYTVWRPSSGTWYVLPTSGGTSIETQWGKSGDVVVPGDYDGDGITDYAVWRPSDGTWYVILSSTGKSTSYVWGESTDIPVPGDYDGDGKTDYAMWRPSTGTWWVVYSSTGRTVSQQWG
jgi:uncharacterized repeat protein (TIGR03803 family)